MSVPGIVQSTLDGEEIVARVSLGGDDELFVSPSSTLIYRADGLLSDESVEEFSHEADRVTISEGRRKARFTLEYSLEGSREFTIPSGKVDAVAHPVIAGVLNGNGITETGESVVQTYRFSELTVIVTSQRLVKHIGEAVWDEDYEEFHYADVTGLSFESGSVATQVVLEVDGRQQRIKAPNEQAADLRERLQRAVFEYHEVDSLEALNEKVGDDGADDGDGDASPTVDFGEGPAPLDTDSSSDADAGRGSTQPDAGTGEAGTDGSEEATAGATDSEPATPEQRGRDDAVRNRSGRGEAVPSEPAAASTGATDAESAAAAGDESAMDLEASGFEPATASADADVLERLDALETAVERQTAILERQQQTIEQLIEELRRGR